MEIREQQAAGATRGPVEGGIYPRADHAPAIAPGHLKVIKRNGSVVAYDDSKIKVAISKAFIAVEGKNAAASSRIHELVDKMTLAVTGSLLRRLAVTDTVHIEDVQELVEYVLMRGEEHKVAQAYVIYREDRRRAREASHPSTSTQPLPQVVLADGARVPLDMQRVRTVVTEACAGLESVDVDLILKDAMRNIYDGAPITDVNKALTMTARSLVEQEPNYTYVAARLLLDALRSEGLFFLGLGEAATFTQMQTLYPQYLTSFIQRGIALDMLNPQLATKFDLGRLGAALQAERDLLFTYLGLQTLYDRYFIHSRGVRYELPQVFFMRVAMGLAIEEDQPTERAIEFYNLLSTFRFMSSTPTLFNSGTLRPQLSSCFLTTVPDDLEGIYNAIRDNALLSKFAGGLGNDWTSVRAMGAHIKGTNGKSSGVVPFLNVADATAVAVNQGGKRKGAVCGYLETWHLDIEEFLELRKNTGDDRRRTHDMNTANWVPDLFMQRVFSDGDWTLFSPNDVPDLHDKYGAAFEQAYIAYELQTQSGKITNFKTISAVKLWRKMLGMLFETGHPWVTFKDVCNLRSPQQHVGVVHSSNLCTEITLNTSQDEIAVCNLGSINLPAHINAQGLDLPLLESTINTAVRMLDNVIDINYYSVPQARNSNFKHRPIGLGLMGFQDALYKLGLDYASDEAVTFADTSMEAISYFAIAASSNLAKSRGSYASFAGSLWSQGILPIDSIQFVKAVRGEYLQQDTSQRLDWARLRTQVQTQGMRNSNVMAIAPTATISNICGVSQSIEPTYQNLFVKSNLSGEFTVVNPYLVADLKRLNLWDTVMVNDLKYFNGSIQQIDRIPEALKRRYATAFEMDPVWLIDAGSRRQKWIDQAQSLNLYMAEPSGKKIDRIYRHAWLMGLKTTYYLRSMGATNAEKSTIHDSALNAVRVEAGPQLCALDDPTCEACQ
jgi:ribonucleoside-diphosphate reductase alpha chain